MSQLQSSLGYTIIELLVVLMLMSLAVAFTIPNLFFNEPSVFELKTRFENRLLKLADETKLNGEPEIFSKETVANLALTLEVDEGKLNVIKDLKINRFGICTDGHFVYLYDGVHDVNFRVASSHCDLNVD